MSSSTSARALVVGLGVSGVAAATLLVRDGWRVTVNDRADAAQLADTLSRLPAGVECVLGTHPDVPPTGTALVVVSPGVPLELPLLAACRQRGLEVIAEVELAARALGDTPIVGVTGSNGKSTVTAMLGEIGRCAGRRVGVGGNIGTAACELALVGGFDAVVLELSSFQLEGCVRLRPRVAVLLNLSPDHLDRHPTMAAYRDAKTRIFAAQTATDVAVLNADDTEVAERTVTARRALFSLVDKHTDAHLDRDTLVLDGAPLIGRRELPLLGEHNVANALAAALSASRLGVAHDAIATALRGFAGLPHRHQLVAEARGVRFVDDSKGTNVGATAAGLAGYLPGTIHLILGGLGKGQDFSELRPALASRVARVYLIGEAEPAIAAALAGAVAIERCGTLARALARAVVLAHVGDTVLLSPACASFDQFRDYGHRGDEFARLAREVVGAARA
jgi:UDP-N-acetylmuramoylalanine--D-glutamate ligase